MVPEKHSFALRLSWQNMARQALAWCGLWACVSAWAWSQHALGTWQSLQSMPELQGVPPVKVETLASFLRAQGPALEAVLSQQEQWSREHLRNYPARPEVLAYRFDPSLDDAALRQRFLHALRVNPQIPLPLFLQLPPHQGATTRPELPASAISTLARDNGLEGTHFVSLSVGEWVPALDVIASAADEPDYGLDLGLWEDNGTDHGRRYGFGKQPFGNPALAFSSQAPFHMGFFHESPVVYAAAGFLRRTYPEYRVHLWQTLARHAMKTGHDYWGWRFSGWALHYVQDLTQPYHARVLPGVSVVRMLGIQGLDLLGVSTPKNKAITLVSNRHLALENFQRHAMLTPWQAGQMDHPMLKVYAPDPQDAARLPWSELSLRDGVAKEAASLADEIDALLAQSFPAQFVSDPSFDFGASSSPVNLFALVTQQSPSGAQVLSQRLNRLFANFGAHSRAWVRQLYRP
jgi:hypothetical protein